MVMGLNGDHTFGFTGAGRICLDPAWEKRERLTTAFAQDSAQDETDVSGPFAKPTHEIGKPFTSEWHIYPHPVAVGGEPRLQIPPDAVQHLELVFFARKSSFLRVRAGGIEHPFVVGRNGRVVAGVEQ